MCLWHVGRCEGPRHLGRLCRQVLLALNRRTPKRTEDLAVEVTECGECPWDDAHFLLAEAGRQADDLLAEGLEQPPVVDAQLRMGPCHVRQTLRIELGHQVPPESFVGHEAQHGLILVAHRAHRVNEKRIVHFIHLVGRVGDFLTDGVPHGTLPHAQLCQRPCKTGQQLHAERWNGSGELGSDVAHDGRVDELIRGRLVKCQLCECNDNAEEMGGAVQRPDGIWLGELGHDVGKPLVAEEFISRGAPRAAVTLTPSRLPTGLFDGPPKP
mmetsp:Transcript_19190/g.55039  ORF Transcript_19190/g.55039 Transcript_19190/m.55039 type:complete len:269 (-) Transcript_19190:594-1400(-)